MPKDFPMLLLIPHRLLTDFPQVTYAKPSFQGARCGKRFPQVKEQIVDLSNKNTGFSLMLSFAKGEGLWS
jgi:hypothetical protein